jgi:hypothetical protein
MSKKTTVKEAIRVVGHLLETDGTKNACARSKSGKVVGFDDPIACKFCLSGACYFVDQFIFGKENYSNQLQHQVAKELGVKNLVLTWDYSSAAERKQIIKKLKNA